MNETLIAIGAVFIVLAGLVHILIWTLESIRWLKPDVWKTFGVASQQDAEVVQPFAYNQGYYNLFLAIGTIGGVILMYALDEKDVGASVAIFAAASMVAAATVLITSNPKMARAAAIQGAMPLVGCVALAIGLAS